MCEKKKLRTKYKALRGELKSAQRDKLITRRLLENFDFSSWFVYLSFGSEADTSELVETLKERGKRVCVPLVKGREMLSVPLSDKLIKGAFGIPEPEEGEEETCEVAVVPMLAFGKEGYRLGYGGGYYDRYFAAHPDVFRLGIAYEGQFCEEKFSEALDEPLDALVTEEKTRYFSARARNLKCGS